MTATALADAPKVVTTIKPLQSIAAAVMNGVGTPQILIDGAASPHGFSLKPSQAAILQDADVVFWIGPDLTPSLEKPISSMAGKATAVAFMDAPGIVHLEIREGSDFETHEHGEAEGDDHAEHAHDDGHEEKDREEHGHAEHGHTEEAHAEEGHAHHDDARDPHIWLNPENGIRIAELMAETLAGKDPENADTYMRNAAAYADRITRMEDEIGAQMAPLSGRSFIVFHDAYHHFEHHFGVEASGSVTVSPEALASADRIREIQDKVKELNVACVFQEPQFDSKLVDVVLEGSSARRGVLDPLGTDLPNGPDLYPDLMTGLAKSLADCLGGAS
jgi:zinc transport system substrate-binding protein